MKIMPLRVAALAFAVLLPSPLWAARSYSRFNRAVAVALNPRMPYRDSGLLKLSQVGGEELIDPLADILEQELQSSVLALEEFEMLAPKQKIAKLEGLMPRAVGAVEEEARKLAANVRRGLEQGKDPQNLHGKADRFLRTYEAYLGNGGAYRDLSMARREAWKLIRAQLEDGGDAIKQQLALGGTDTLSGPAVASTAETGGSPKIAKLKYSHGYYLEQLASGMTAVVAQPVAVKDIDRFAKASGDDQDIHTTPHAAEDSILGGPGPIAHGVLTLGYFSKVLGTKLPGPGTIFAGLDQVRFRKAVRAGDQVNVKVVVLEVSDKKTPIKLPKPRDGKTHVLAGKVKLSLEATVAGEVVLTGEATVFVESKEPAPVQ